MLLENIEKTINEILSKVKRNALRVGSKIPLCILDNEGKYVLGDGGGWTDAFWVGILYLAYNYTLDKDYLAFADAYQQFFRDRVNLKSHLYNNETFLPLDHDTGFIFSLSQVARYKLIGDYEAKVLALKASELLALRYNEKGKFIRAWDTWPWDTEENFIEEKKGKIIIDSIMNVPLLMWAYDETEIDRYREIAINHTDTVMKYIVRNDYSTYHTYNFNPYNGEALYGKTQQGYDDVSCWSRGQSWAIYGFTLMYAYTKNENYLLTAKGLAEYFINYLPKNCIPYWDFDVAHLEFKPWDSSAGAIAACALIDLSKYVIDIKEKTRYETAAKNIIEALIKLCSTLYNETYEPLLLHGCVGSAYRKNEEKQILVPYVDTPMIYGDYFFVEALMKLKNKNMTRFW